MQSCTCMCWYVVTQGCRGKKSERIYITILIVIMFELWDYGWYLFSFLSSFSFFYTFSIFIFYNNSNKSVFKITFNIIPPILLFGNVFRFHHNVNQLKHSIVRYFQSECISWFYWSMNIFQVSLANYTHLRKRTLEFYIHTNITNQKGTEY